MKINQTTMKLILIVIFTLSIFLVPTQVLALDPATNALPVIGTIGRPPELSNLPKGAAGIGVILGVFIDIVYVISGIVFLFMMLMGAFQWLTSGGDKEALGAARKRILNAFIGITLLAFAALIVNVVGRILNFKIFS